MERDPDPQEILKAVERYRQQVKAEYLAMLSPALEKMAEEGKFLFEGRWLTIEEIQALRKARKRRHRIIFIEVLLLFMMIATITYGLYGALRFLLPS